MTPAAFPHRVAEHAASGALRDLLEHHRLSYAPEPLSEGAIFGFSGALDLRVRIAGTAIPTIDLDGRAASLELELCRHLGIDARWRETSDPGDGWDVLRSQLAAGRPTVVRADPAQLDYRRGARHDTRHAVVVTGCDDEAGVAFIADGSFPEPQRCGMRSLAAARASQGWPAPARHGLLQITAQAPRLCDPRAAVTLALHRVVHAMRCPPRPDHPHVRAGLGAVDALAAAWPGLPKVVPARDLGAALAAVRYRIRDGGTGGALYRSLQARFLHDAAALLGSPQLGHAALVCDDLADAWRTLAAAIDNEHPALAHRVGEPWVHRIRSLEHQHVEALEEHLKNDRTLAA
ncbi:MAG: BtrH N-terminal domain-containing protein [Actinobacteria bacterium]|nr:BtrH N-terminal domain-containing protein [Actinomycetota bacterium]